MMRDFWVAGLYLVLLILVTDLFHSISFATANSKMFFPAPWLDGTDVEQHPVNIWYWVREQSFTGPPRSCAVIQLRATENKPVTGISEAKIWFAWVTTFSVRPRSSVGRVTVDLIRRSWVRFPPRSKDFFFTSCGSLIPLTRANARWVIHGFN